MQRLIPIATLMFLLSSQGTRALATPQLDDKLIFGGKRYNILQIPMLAYWDYGQGSTGTGKVKPPQFEVTSSANWRGYKAVWEIRDSKFFLKKITARINGRSVKDAQILNGKEFPLQATWFSGQIHLVVGDYNYETSQSTAVITFHIRKGVVTKMTFRETAKVPYSWNGVVQEVQCGQ